MRTPISVIFALLCASLICTAKTPNIIIILADDMGKDSVSAYNSKLGFKTPRIDSLITESLSFTDGHTSSAVCTPSRYGLLTGRYSWRSRLKKGIIPRWDTPLLEEGRLTMGAMLQEKGYNTACIGKWHLGWNWPFSSDKPLSSNEKKSLAKLASEGMDWSRPVTGGPVDRGFDYYFGDDVINWPPFVYIENRKVLGTPDSQNGWKTPDSDWAKDEVLPLITSKAVTYIEQQAKSEKPFFLYFPMTSPHSPIAPSDKFKGISKISPYVDFVIETDHSVGRIIDAVDKAGIAEDTLIIFSADNGTSLTFPERDGTYDKGVSFNTNVRGGKSDIWEGGHKVPFIVRWKGKVAAGTANSTPVCLTDIMATVAEIVGYDLPDNAAEDSVSLLPALNGQPFKRSPIINHSITGRFAIRSGDWKLEFCPGSGGWSLNDEEATKEGLPPLQLYNMADDSLEQSNVAERYPERVEQLTKELTEIIENGRSTPGAPQKNVGKTWTP